jgi:hypothetical protein
MSMTKNPDEKTAAWLKQRRPIGERPAAKGITSVRSRGLLAASFQKGGRFDG